MGTLGDPDERRQQLLAKRRDVGLTDAEASEFGTLLRDHDEWREQMLAKSRGVGLMDAEASELAALGPDERREQLLTQWRDDGLTDAEASELAAYFARADRPRLEVGRLRSGTRGTA